MRLAPYRIFSFFPCFSNAESALSQSSFVSPAFIMVRMRDLSRATIGNTIGKANTPSSKSPTLRACALADSPHIAGVMGVVELPMS